MEIVNIKSRLEAVKSTHHILTKSDLSLMHLLVENCNDYLLITGEIKLSEDYNLNLSTVGAVNGCQYTIQLDCKRVDLEGHSIIICYNFASPGYTILKTLKQADINAMLNKEGGIIIKFRFYDGKWREMEQNYSYGMPGTVTIFSGELDKYFDKATGTGNARGYYGYKVFARPGDSWPVNVPILPAEPGNDIALIKQLI